MVRQPAGQAALVLECVLVIMMAGQVRQLCALCLCVWDAEHSPVASKEVWQRAAVLAGNW